MAVTLLCVYFSLRFSTLSFAQSRSGNRLIHFVQHFTKMISGPDSGHSALKAFHQQHVVTALHRRLAFLNDQVRLKDEQLIDLKTHVDLLQQELKAAKTQSSHWSIEPHKSDTLLLKGRRVMSDYKHQVQALQQALLASEEKNLYQLREIFHLQNIIGKQSSGISMTTSTSDQ